MGYRERFKKEHIDVTFSNTENTHYLGKTIFDQLSTITPQLLNLLEETFLHSDVKEVLEIFLKQLETVSNQIFIKPQDLVSALISKNLQNPAEPYHIFISSDKTSLQIRIEDGKFIINITNRQNNRLRDANFRLGINNKKFKRLNVQHTFVEYIYFQSWNSFSIKLQY